MIRKALKVANESLFYRARVGAVIAKGSRILSTGCNKIGYSKLLPDRPYPESIHAEQAAIINLLRERRLSDLAGATIYVSRIGSGGSPRLARPCNYCHQLIESVGIKEVIFTTNTGEDSYEL